SEQARRLNGARNIFPFPALLSNRALCLAVAYAKTYFSSRDERSQRRGFVSEPMALPLQTAALLKAARQLLDELSADAVLLLTETDLDWAEVLDILPVKKLLISAKDPELNQQLQEYPHLRVLDIDPGPT